MSNYRRAYRAGGTFFFTVVTYRRRNLFDRPECRKMLRDAIEKVRENRPFVIDAWVLLPDHMHCIWTLPENDHDFSIRWSLIKSRFSKLAKPLLHNPGWITAFRHKHRESTIWQRRFWEHRIRDERDFRTHTDYIHYNPVKHGFATRTKDWPHSTFHRHARQGIYSPDRGGGTITDPNRE